MKKLILLTFVAVMFFSCQKQQLFNQSPEIELTKQALDAALKMDWAAHRSFFADTAAIYVNSWFHERFTPDSFIEGLKKHTENVAKWSLAPNSIYEMVVGTNGDHWVHIWTELTYTLKNGKEISTPEHLVCRVENNKIVFYGVVLDALPRYLAENAIQKSSLISVHTVTVTLKPGVSLEQYKEFYMTKVIPESEKLVPGVKGYLVNAVRGEKKSSLGVIWVFPSEELRNQYFNDDGTTTELGNAVMEKIKPVYDELYKLGTSSSKYTDWVVQ